VSKEELKTGLLGVHIYLQKEKLQINTFFIFQVFTIIRSMENPQLLSIELVKGGIKTYTSTDRWLFLF